MRMQQETCYEKKSCKDNYNRSFGRIQVFMIVRNPLCRGKISGLDAADQSRTNIEGKIVGPP